jgi:hypothetical protein
MAELHSKFLNAMWRNIMRSIKILFYCAIVVMFSTSITNAAVFTPTFVTPDFPGTQFDVDTAHNDYYNTNFGITVQNAYLYKDSRDTFDGIGISNGLVANNYQPNQTGRINFLDSTDFVTIDFLAVRSTTFEAFSSAGTLISTFLATSGTGTFTLNGGIIAYIDFTSDGGFGAISGWYC